MKRLAGVLLLFAAAAMGAELTGKWSGDIEIKAPDGQIRQDTALLDLKAEGQTVTGTVGRDAERRIPIQNGKLDGSKVTFEVVPDNGPLIRFELLLEGERLHGMAKAEEGERRMEVKFDLKKAP